MATPYSIDDWNQVIKNVNALAKNPPSGCNPLSPLQEVTAPHKWSVDDVSQMQELLLKICSSNTFTSHKLWEQSIIDEINAAIKLGWCGCQQQSGSAQIILGSYAPAVYSNCLGNLNDDGTGTMNLDAMVIGISLPVPKGYQAVSSTLFWSFSAEDAFCIAHYPVIENTVGGPPTVCGLGNPLATENTSPPNGIAVICEGHNCEGAGCQAAINNAQSQLKPGNVQLILNYQYQSIR